MSGNSRAERTRGGDNLPEIESQKRLIHETDWDNLIILDACRYDYFEKFYDEYLSGELREVVSSGINTSSWVDNTFSGFDFPDVVYVSGNPHINSKGVGYGSFDGSEIFYKVMDVWDYGWDEEKQTTPPSVLGKEMRRARMKYPKKRLICHFVQPHAPYLSIGPLKYNARDRSLEKRIEGRARRNGIRRKVGKMLERYLGKLVVHKMRAKLGLSMHGPSAKVSEKYGDEKLREAYRENLIRVLKEVSKLTDRLPNEKIVVTADHGELLGEEGLYSHSTPHPLLKKVPWMEEI